MNTTETLYQESLELLNMGNEMWKNKKFEDASIYYCQSIQKIMSSILNVKQIPNSNSFIGTYTVFNEFKKNDSKFSNSTNAYTLDMMFYFEKKVGYFEGKKTFDKDFIKEIKKLHKFLVTELDQAKSKKDTDLNTADILINALNNNGIDFFK